MARVDRRRARVVRRRAGLGRGAARLGSGGAVARTLARIRPDTPLWLVALLQLALQSEVAGLVLGAARYPVGRYFAALAAVEVVFAGLTVAVGTGLMARQPVLLAVAGAAFVVLAVGALAVVHRRLPPGTPPRPCPTDS